MTPQTISAAVYPGWVITALFTWAGAASTSSVALILYTWKERTTERTINGLRVALEEKIDIESERITMLERSVDGYGGKDGLRNDVRILKRSARWTGKTLSLMAVQMKIHTEDMPDQDEAEDE